MLLLREINLFVQLAQMGDEARVTDTPLISVTDKDLMIGIILQLGKGYIGHLLDRSRVVGRGRTREERVPGVKTNSRLRPIRPTIHYKSKRIG